MKKIEMVKTVVGVIVSIGVGAIVNNVVKSTTPFKVKTVTKICTAIGGFVLASIISDKAVDYSEKIIDKTVDAVKKVTDDEVEAKEEDSETESKEECQ
jgi:uncharacterized membrane protein YeiH